MRFRTFNAGVYTGQVAGKLTTRLDHQTDTQKEGKDLRNIWHVIAPCNSSMSLFAPHPTAKETYKRGHVDTKPHIYCATDPQSLDLFLQLAWTHRVALVSQRARDRSVLRLQSRLLVLDPRIRFPSCASRPTCHDWAHDLSESQVSLESL